MPFKAVAFNAKGITC